MPRTLSKALRVEYLDPRTLNPAPYNPRKITGEARKRLRRSLESFGFVDPIIARREDLLVLGGHQRLDVGLNDLELGRVPVILLDGISDARAKALNIALNNATMSGDWDTEKLRDVLLDLRDTDFALDTGFSEKELATWLGEPLSTELDFSDTGDDDLLRDKFICSVECTNENELAKLYNELSARGFACKMIT